MFKTCSVGYQIKENNMRNTELHIRYVGQLSRSKVKVTKYNCDCSAVVTQAKGKRMFSSSLSSSKMTILIHLTSNH